MLCFFLCGDDDDKTEKKCLLLKLGDDTLANKKRRVCLMFIYD